jgi:hypothetical protein
MMPAHESVSLEASNIEMIVTHSQQHCDEEKEEEEAHLLDTTTTTTTQSMIEFERDGQLRARKGFELFGVEMSPDTVAIALVYFVQGVLGLARLAVNFFLKDDLHLDPAEVGGWLSLPLIQAPRKKKNCRYLGEATDLGCCLLHGIALNQALQAHRHHRV